VAAEVAVEAAADSSRAVIVLFYPTRTTGSDGSRKTVDKCCG